MTTYTQIIYQIVFSTKHRSTCLTTENRIELYKYINSILVNKKCHPFRINGVADHIHIITDLHPEIALSSLVKDIKLATSAYIYRTNLFPKFIGWQVGFGAFTYSINEKNRLIEYVKNQEMHHMVKSSLVEIRDLLREHNVEFDERYLY